MRVIYCTVLLLFIQLTVFAQADISQLLSKLETSKNDSQKMNAYTGVFSYYLYTNADSAVFYGQKGLDYFIQKKNKLGQARMLNMLATEDENRGRTNIAKTKYLNALQLYTEINNKQGIAGVKDNLGVLDAKEGDYGGAIKYFIDALKLAEEISDTDVVVQTYIKLGATNEQDNNLDRALDYYNKAELIQSNRPVSIATITLYNNIGIIYGKKGDYGKALANFNKAIQNSDKPMFTELLILSYINAGIAYGHFNDKANAMKNLNAALKIATDRNLPEDRARTLVNIASVYGQSDAPKAVKLLNEALDEAKKIDLKDLRMEIYGDLVDVYTQQKDYKDALNTMEEQQSLKDSLFSLDKAKEIANLQSVYDLDKSKANVEALKIFSYKNNRDKHILILVGFILVGFFVVLIFYYRKAIRLNEQLFSQKETLRTLNTVKDKMFSILGHDLKGPIARIPVMLEIYEDTTTTPEERVYIFEQLKEHVQASTETLDKLLYWGQSQIKGTALSKIVFETKEHITKSIQLIKSAADHKQITINDTTENQLMINAEPAHFDFVVRNLLSNAIKFTHSNGIIEISADKNRLPGFIVYAIKDDGIGIAPELQKAIFEPFGNSTDGTADEKGTSIGLMLCKEFITANGGSIWVESKKDAGATFYFSVKAA